MKKWILAGSVLAALSFGTALTVLADDGPSGPGGMDRLGKMKEKLGLSDAQVTQLKDLFKNQKEEMKPLRDQVKIDMDTLQQKIDTKASEGEIKKLLDGLSSDRDKLDVGRKKMETKLRSILSPIQQAKFVLGIKARGEKMKGKWTHHKDGKGMKDDAAKPPVDDAGAAQ